MSRPDRQPRADAGPLAGAGAARDVREPGPAPGHLARLRTAWSLLRELPFADAIAGIREATPAGALHATRMLFWARMVDAAIARSGPGADFEAFLAVHPELGAADHELSYYSPERLATPRARREFVLPDRAPLPAPSRCGDRRGSPDGRGTKTVSSG